MLPDLKLGVVDYRVFQLVPLDGALQIAGFLLIGELGRMDTDHGQFVGIFLFQFPQLRKLRRLKAEAWQVDPAGDVPCRQSLDDQRDERGDCEQVEQDGEVTEPTVVNAEK